MASVHRVQKSEGLSNSNYDDIMQLYRPANGISTEVFLFKPAFMLDGNGKETKRTLEDLYNLNFFEHELKVYKDTSLVYHLHLEKFLIHLMKSNEVWVESDYANNEEDLKWIRSICFEQFFKINVFEDDNAIFRQKTAPYKRDSTNGAKGLPVGKADFSNIPVLQVRLRRALKKKIWLTHRPRSDSAAMEEFFQNLEVDDIDKDEMVENYLNYLWTMHRVVTIFDLVKASVLENFTGTSRTFLEDTKTWNNFIMAVRHESDAMATDTFKNEYYPAVLDEEIFDRDFANAESDFEKSIVVSDRLEGINKYHNEFEKAYGKDYLMYFLMNEQYLDILSILRNFQEMDYDASRDKVLSSLLVPREPAELIREGNGDGGLGFYKKLLAYQHTFTKIAVKSDSRNIPVELPETLSAQLSLLQKTKFEVPDKLLKNSDRDVIKGHIEKT